MATKLSDKNLKDIQTFFEKNKSINITNLSLPIVSSITSSEVQKSRPAFKKLGAIYDKYTPLGSLNKMLKADKKRDKSWKPRLAEEIKLKDKLDRSRKAIQKKDETPFQKIKKSVMNTFFENTSLGKLFGIGEKELKKTEEDQVKKPEAVEAVMGPGKKNLGAAGGENKTDSEVGKGIRAVENMEKAMTQGVKTDRKEKKKQEYKDNKWKAGQNKTFETIKKSTIETAKNTDDIDKNTEGLKSSTKEKKDKKNPVASNLALMLGAGLLGSDLNMNTKDPMIRMRDALIGKQYKLYDTEKRTETFGSGKNKRTRELKTNNTNFTATPEEMMQIAGKDILKYTALGAGLMPDDPGKGAEMGLMIGAGITVVKFLVALLEPHINNILKWFDQIFTWLSVTGQQIWNDISQALGDVAKGIQGWTGGNPREENYKFQKNTEAYRLATQEKDLSGGDMKKFNKILQPYEDRTHKLTDEFLKIEKMSVTDANQIRDEDMDALVTGLEDAIVKGRNLFAEDSDYIINLKEKFDKLLTLQEKISSNQQAEGDKKTSERFAADQRKLDKFLQEHPQLVIQLK